MCGLSFSIGWDWATQNAHRSNGCKLQVASCKLIPPSEDGGYFNSNLHQNHPTLQSHRRKTLDVSIPAYIGITSTL